jgi:hypothetical protein
MKKSFAQNLLLSATYSAYFFKFVNFCLPDFNECLSEDKVCKSNEECHNKENGFECRCKAGMKRENDDCVCTLMPDDTL